MNSDSLYGQRIVPYIMSEEDSVDIDTPFDLQVADWLIRSRQQAPDLI
jgi:CMP-N-acetylneuraminic acid synthetase